MKKVFMVLALLVVLSGGLFADWGQYFVDTDNMSGEQSIRIVYVDENTDAKLITIINLSTGNLLFAVTEDYMIYGYGDVAQSMYKFDSNSPVTTYTKLVNTGFTAIFYKDVEAFWDGVRSSNVLAIRIMNDSTGTSRDYTFEMSGYQQILRDLNLL